ncbi:adenylyl-sulfate kinase [Variovorax sp. ZS18.2.2]|uniref:adenylyl-sulfate kinase n=1 Tax=Variovorax sp. ZS18.2.2 TaxID=2971255 RepID=UPI0021509A3B|nr:adenylyl-sulfate kinase [Variovorax sp. ZS18.2.2]MCR6476508.1 adenylyl-sulfate kinase [Variovorax sp. ZS18.2.2]
MTSGLGRCYWMTGLPGSGKTSIVKGVQQRLRLRGVACLVLDGDEVRRGLSSDLDFARSSRRENARRIAEVARLGVEAGLVVLVASITPFRIDREMARDILPKGSFIEVHVAASLAVCSTRDPKGLYAKARAGELTGLSGWDAEYEQPNEPNITLNPEHLSLQQSVELIAGHAAGATA